MQDPPPVFDLLNELAAFATAVGQILSGNGVDWHVRPDGEEWSLTEVIWHLLDVEHEVHQSRFRDLIDRENVFLPGATSDDWVAQREYQKRDGRQALLDFLLARQQTLTLLGTIEDDTVWERRGRHAYFGPTSLHELLYLAVQHDRAHWEQIQALCDQMN